MYLCATIYTHFMINIAILASGNGTNAENIIRHFNDGNTGIQVRIVITNNHNAYVLRRAEMLGVKSVILPKETLLELQTPKDERRKDIKNPKIQDILKKYNINFIILAGYLLKIPESLIRKYPDKIINIHPALLPRYGGKGMYGAHVHEAVIAAREKESGITIHLVNEKYDSGEILFQAKCQISPDETADDLAAKIHLLEQTHFPRVIEEYILKHQSE